MSSQASALVTYIWLCYNFFGNHGDKTVAKEWGNPLFNLCYGGFVTAANTDIGNDTLGGYNL
ncbi:hypothetical protein ACE3NQ_13160 [Paenibacillus terreus]|uniref:Uncharacterized protein n=1 Tax=Paenibacillus terreus TaxID=1387834 RepID=A0ABV5BAG2_9BACL